jgi:hypothetical protein
MNPGRSSPVRSLDDVERSAGAPSTSKVHIFASFDIEHDGELYELLLAQSRTQSSGFAVLGGSERGTATDVCSERVRRRIRQADQVIVICGEHTEASRFRLPSLSAKPRRMRRLRPCATRPGRAGCDG